MTSDTIADMLTRVRNANAANHRTVVIPASRMKAEIARVLKEEGFIADYAVSGETPQEVHHHHLQGAHRRGAAPSAGCAGSAGRACASTRASRSSPGCSVGWGSR